jgi:hypothetical protein
MRITGDIVDFAANVSSGGSLQTSVTGTVTVAGTVSIGSGSVEIVGEVTTKPSPTSTPTESVVSVITSDQQLVAANGARKQLYVYNSDSTNGMFIRLSSSAATSSYIRIGPRESWSPPPGVTLTGEVRVIGEASLTAIVYEF